MTQKIMEKVGIFLVSFPTALDLSFFIFSVTNVCFNFCQVYAMIIPVLVLDFWQIMQILRIGAFGDVKSLARKKIQVY